MEALEVEPGQVAAQLQLAAGDVPPSRPAQPRVTALGRPRPRVGRHLAQVVGAQAGGRRHGQRAQQQRLRPRPQCRGRRHDGRANQPEDASRPPLGSRSPLATGAGAEAGRSDAPRGWSASSPSDSLRRDWAAPARRW